MKIAHINACNYGSTGFVVNSISDEAIKYGIVCLKCFPNTTNNKKRASDSSVFYGNKIVRNVENRLALQFGCEQNLYKSGTRQLIKFLRQFEPDIIHLHNIHGCFVNLTLLFGFLKKYNKPVVWTLHDCWSFTGRCPHFVLLNCYKWKTGCGECHYPKDSYPASKIDRTRYMWNLKRMLFTSINSLTIITPSKWLAGLVEQSYFYGKDVRVINNGINLSVFKPIESRLKIKYNCGNKYIVLGVSFGWSKQKGLDVFLELSKRLDSFRYQIVLVGTDEKVDKLLPENIISIHRTQDQKELAEIYSAADVFFNPTREENYPTVNMEALACGTPVITFNTGGSPEIVDEKTGIVVDVDCIEDSIRAIQDVCERKIVERNDCIKSAEAFDIDKRLQDYIKLYQELISIKS